jgi:hypothetical protein
MEWLPDDPIAARIVAEIPAFVVLTMISAGRSAETVIVIGLSVLPSVRIVRMPPDIANLERWLTP